MALNTYELTATVTVAAGTLETPTMAGSPGGTPTPNSISYGSEATTAGYDVKPQTFLKGQLIVLDPSGTLFSLIGGGNLRQVTPAQETGGFIGTSN